MSSLPVGVTTATITRGSPWTHTVRIIDVDANDGARTPRDLTGTSWLAQVRHTPEDSHVVATATVSVQDLLGEITMTISADDTKALTDGDHIELLCTDDDRRWWRSQLRVQGWIAHGL